MSCLNKKVKKNELGNFTFAIGYISKYRYFKQKLLESELDNLREVIPNLKTEQYDNLEQTIEIEMIMNAIQYCSDFGAIATIVKNKKIDTILQSLSSFSEESIKQFYDKIRTSENNTIRKYMGYQELKLTSQQDYSKYNRSCDRYKKDVIILSTFYKKYYQIYLSYKHGLRIIPNKNDKGDKFIIEAVKDNTVTIHMIPPMWYLEAIEVTEIIKNIFEKLYIPYIMKQFGDFSDISFNDENIKKTIESKDPPDPTRQVSLNINFSFPWWIHDATEPNPFY